MVHSPISVSIPIKFPTSMTKMSTFADVFVRDGLKVNNISVCEEDNVESITVELLGVVVHSVYIPPNEQFLPPPLGSRNMFHILSVDFSSHIILCGYTSTNHD